LLIPAVQLARAVAPLQLDLPPAAAAQLAPWLALVKQYSRGFNLTGFAGPRELIFELAVESLRLLTLGEIAAGWRCVDLGSGAGAPVVPLAIACPRAAFTAVEAGAKRAAFLRAAVARLGLANLDVYPRRAEELAREQPAGFDLVTSRAFAPPDKLLPLATKLLSGGGQLRGYLGADRGGFDASARRHGFSVTRLSEYEADAAPRSVYLLTRDGGS
jgi:16S rRNA (guanine527-N7)-methyltransferase